MTTKIIFHTESRVSHNLFTGADYSKIIIIYLLLYVFTACDDGEDDRWRKPSDNTIALEGVWQTVGYGRILDIRNGTAILFDIAAEGCVSQSNFFDVTGFNVSEWDIEINKSKTQFKYKSKSTINTYVFTKLKTLPAACENGGLQTTDALANFDYLWSVFNEHYAFFKDRNIDWSAMRDQYRSQVSSDNLWEILTAMLSEFQEDHVTLMSDDGQVFKAGQEKLFERFYHEYVDAGSPDGFETYVQTEYGKLFENIQLNYLKGELKTAGNDKIFWGKLTENIGYLHILEMNGFTEPYDYDQQVSILELAMDAAMDELKMFDKIVIDVRFNSGGFDKVSLEIAGRFTGRSKPVWNVSARNGTSFTEAQSITLKPSGKLQYEKQVLILTSQFTASAAETFTLAMKQLAHVKTMGENTNGIFSTMLQKRMPNNWYFTLSNERWSDPSGNNYEVSGIPPDIEAPFPSRDERDNGFDPVLEKAIAHFQ